MIKTYMPFAFLVPITPPGVGRINMPKDADILAVEIAYIDVIGRPTLRVHALVTVETQRLDKRVFYVAEHSQELPQGVGAGDFITLLHHQEGPRSRTFYVFVGQYDRGVMTKEMPKAHADIMPGYKTAKYNTLEND